MRAQHTRININARGSCELLSGFQCYLLFQSLAGLIMRTSSSYAYVSSMEFVNRFVSLLVFHFAVTVKTLTEQILFLLFFHILFIMFFWAYWQTVFTVVAIAPNKVIFFDFLFNWRHSITHRHLC